MGSDAAAALHWRCVTCDLPPQLGFVPGGYQYLEPRAALVGEWRAWIVSTSEQKYCHGPHRRVWFERDQRVDAFRSSCERAHRSLKADAPVNLISSGVAHGNHGAHCSCRWHGVRRAGHLPRRRAEGSRGHWRQPHKYSARQCASTPLGCQGQVDEGGRARHGDAGAGPRVCVLSVGSFRT